MIAGGAALALPAAVLGLPLGAWIFMLVIGATDPADGPGRPHAAGLVVVSGRDRRARSR